MAGILPTPSEEDVEIFRSVVTWVLVNTHGERYLDWFYLTTCAKVVCDKVTVLLRKECVK